MTGLSTNAIHGADHLSTVTDVMPPINVSTTYKFDNDNLIPAADLPVQDFEIPIYAREAHSNSAAVEAALGKMTGAHAVAYNSGLSAFHAAITYLNPKVLAIGGGYHGCHGVADIISRNYNMKQVGLDEFEKLGKGDVLHLETPINPHGTNYDIQYYADKAHAQGAYLLVDATFAPPPLQDPFLHGADMVMHSATKYFGGHSDLLAGVLLTKSKDVKYSLLMDKQFLGTNIANLESYLLLRSLRTFELRINQQIRNTELLLKAIVDGKFPAIKEIFHGSLQTDEYIAKQVNGCTPCFSIILQSEAMAKAFPKKLKYFHHATSLGGVESLVEWRAMSDTEIDTALVRVSVGVENSQDLIDDFTNALNEAAKEFQ